MAAKPAKSAKHPLVRDVVAAVHRIAPPELAESWDNVGLQLGHPASPAGRILVALEATREVLAEAKTRKAGTLVLHHPLLFKPPRSFSEDGVTASLAAETIRANMALIAAHTNLDSVALGTNGELADRLGMQAAGRTFLRPHRAGGDMMKYVVFVPDNHADAVVKAMGDAGGGAIGRYSHCTFRAAGTGTFLPLEGAEPFLGKVGRMEQASEFRIECVIPRRRVSALLNAVRSAHPYEEIAFDLFALENASAPTAGLGLVGNLKKPLTVAALATLAKKAVGCTTVGIVGDAKKKIERIAICTGAGGEFVRNWRPGTADAFITGEMNHHDCAEASHRGLPVLLVGHWESEAMVCERFAGLVGQELSAAGFSADIIASSKQKNPLRWV